MADRLIEKNGELRAQPKQRTWSNPFNADNAVLLDWVPLCQAVLMSFFVSWTIFAAIYYGFSSFNNDICEEAEVCQKLMEDMCVFGVFDFSAAFLFSVETQTTIGYGSRHINDRCPIVVFIVVLQSFVGIIIYGVSTGLIIAKFKIPSTRRRSLIRFSERAVVMLKDQQLWLVVKVVDEADVKLKGISITAYLAEATTTKEGRVLPAHANLAPIDFGVGGLSGGLPLIWPVSLAHRIDSRSPLWTWGPEDSRSWEVQLWVQGFSKAGNGVVARTSYTPSQVEWGAVFQEEVDQVVIQHKNMTVVSGPAFPTKQQEPSLRRESGMRMGELGEVER